MLDSTHIDEDLLMFRDTVRRMAEKEVAPIAAKIDQDDDMPHSLVPIFGDLGLIQIMVPEEYGGPGGTTTMACILLKHSWKLFVQTCISLRISMNCIHNGYLDS